MGVSRALGRGSVLALALGGVALAAPSLAQANPNCNSVITHSVTLHSNMSCPGTTALFVGNDGITINLNGFTISGNNTNNTNGIDNAGDWSSSAHNSGGTSGPGAGFNRVTIENGNVRDFVTGIFVNKASRQKISNMTATGNGCNGLDMLNSITATITGSHFNRNGFTNNCDGVDMAFNAKVVVGPEVSADGNESFGLFDEDSQATLNKVRAKQNGAGGFGIDAPLAKYLVEHSLAKGNHNGDGFHVESNQFGTITFTSNTSENNNGWGYFADVHAKGTNNGFQNDSSGGCHNVGGCHHL